MRPVLLLVLAAAAFAQEAKRPPITGVAHVALFVADVEKTRAFYKGFLGYGEPFDLKKPDGGLSLTFLKINERQYLEIFPETAAGTDRFNHVSIETANAEALRQYLAARGVKVPEKVNKGRTGNTAFNVKDPDGHTVEFVEYEPDSFSSRARGKFMGPERISARMSHYGILVGKLDDSLRFYRDVLGFRETWRGSRDEKQLSWVNLQLPDGEDYIELMLYTELPAPDKRGTPHHICLEVPDLDKTLAVLEARKAKVGYSRPMEIKTGINRRRQLNLYDPDGTRVELMEPGTVDGQPAPSSTAPPPR